MQTSFFRPGPHGAGDRRGDGPWQDLRRGVAWRRRAVLIASRKAEAREAAARELSDMGPCEGFGGTVANEAGVAALAAETRKRTDALHILINNAGANWGGSFETFPWNAWDRVLSVNVTGLFTLTRELARC